MDRDTAAQRLEQERDEVGRRLAVMSAELDALAAAVSGSNIDDEHDPEGATVAFEREQLAALRDTAQHTLAEIDAAQARLAEGTYGTCETCGRPIADERLAALPAARRCVHCAARAHRPSS